MRQPAFTIITIFCLTLSVGACTHRHGQGGHHQTKAEKGSWQSGDQYYFRSNTYFMGQPSLKTLNEAKTAGVTTVINLRPARDLKTLGYDAKAETEKRGLKYYHFGIDPEKPLDKNTLAQVEATFMRHHKAGEKVIVHCNRGQVTAGWFAYHVRFTHGENSAQALKEAGEMGLSWPDLVAKVKTVIGE